MKTQQAYDAQRTPPAPILPLRVGVPRGEATVAVVALVDSGADMTVLPQAVVRQIGLPAIGEITVRGVGGASRRVPLYAAQVEAPGVSRVIEVTGLGQEALLGRDLLNGWVVTLDGPRQILRVEL